MESSLEPVISTPLTQPSQRILIPFEQETIPSKLKPSHRPKTQRKKVSEQKESLSFPSPVLQPTRSPRPVVSATPLKLEPDFQLYQEPYRPRFHFSPLKNWMNDPNGMIYYKGLYHLFYQHNPEQPKWGNISWGHAVSRDLIHWEHKKVALRPDIHGLIFSGSAVVDDKNTSGLKAGDDDVLVALYTQFIGRQRQSLAYSNDGGENWIKHPDNPILKTFFCRDPKVFWHSKSQKWVMSITCGERVHFYTSHDLKTWVEVSIFGKNQGIQKGLFWECPDLFELSVEGHPNLKKWVLLVSIDNGNPNGGSGVQYFVGEFDGQNFFNQSKSIQYLDYGKDHYCTQSWTGLAQKEQRKLVIGWMNNWQYARSNKVPTRPWNGVMTIPRHLTLHRKGNQFELLQHPVEELKELRKKASLDIQLPLNLSFKEVITTTGSFELMLEGQLKGTDIVQVIIQDLKRQQVVVSYNQITNELSIKRMDPIEGSFSNKFAGQHKAPLKLSEQSLKLHLFFDQSTLEVFANDGTRVLSDLVFLSSGKKTIQLIAQGQPMQVKKFQLWELETIW